MTTTIGFVTVCLAFAMMISIRVHAIAVGETYCIEGYVMDYYCIKDGFLLDNPSVVTLEGPDQHSIHCLVDVDVCVTSPYEILTDPSEDGGLYGRGWRVTDTSQQILVDLARTVGDQCYTCFNLGMQTRGFRAVMNATVVALASGDIPPIVEVHTAFPTSVINEDVVTDGTHRTVRLSETDDPCLEYYSMPAEAPSTSIDGSDIPTPTSTPLNETDSNISNTSPSMGGSDIPTVNETDSNISTTVDETDSNISNSTVDEPDSSGARLQRMYGILGYLAVLAWLSFY